MSVLNSDDFEQLYADADPFGYRSRWYEQRKRAVLLAALPFPLVDRGWEFGCSNGELTAELGTRCTRLLATDLSHHAVKLASERVQQHPGITLQQANHPADWPTGQFDLIVFSEVGYYLDATAFERTVALFATSLAPQGCLVACHWRHPFEGAVRSAEHVHQALDQVLARDTLCCYEDADFLLQAWMAGPSIAQREQLR
ncbi:class I SAM-dependent DNA methyltransferase [Xanthomonas campestris]|uniref:class I SAM-dependent DNA methyltransferase n=1 Tax=Xanthomonas campestris TaxID=339 RepID=UPI0023655BFD|nr:class I SAM-dependent methyltransferase [Xanthomonas campestris]WDJ04733.1 class I SAM-dependent methyltransferase [Xanthomonas campestris pv. incanae]